MNLRLLPAYAVFAAFLTVAVAYTAGDNVHPKVVRQEAFTVIGIEVRTDNRTEAGPGGAIPKLWQRFMQEGVAAKIPNKTDDKIYALYSQYDSDYHGPYSYTIGMRVSASEKLPEGLVSRGVSAGDYAVVTTAIGPVWQVVPLAWKQIWSLEDSGTLGGVRAYATDFEIYDERAHDPQNAQVDICLGLKPRS
jgi:predicted transcriptional regulator YdeE